MQHRIFVYGTLRRGGTNHYLLRFATFLGTYTTPAMFTMIDFGEYPGIIARGQTAIRGEIYQISARLLKRLDILEQYPRVYGRLLLNTPAGDAWAYVLVHRPRRAKTKASGDWFAEK